MVSMQAPKVKKWASRGIETRCHQNLRMNDIPVTAW
jgi:hypothetical protein